MIAQDMKLKRVLGFTTNGRNSFIVQPSTGNVIYIAGCVVVILNPQLRNQKHLITDSKQSITTLAITEDGKYLAAANCGLQSMIYVWDLFTTALVAEFVAHNVEVSCMCFSATNGHYLVSVGAQNDMTLSVWDWRRQVRLAHHKMTTKVRAVSFGSDDSYFVTVGEAYAKYWYLHDSGTDLHLNDIGTKSNSTLDSSSISISCRSAMLGEQKRKNFCDVKCGRGLMADSTFCITKDGLLCELNKRRLLHKWVDLRTSAANCLAVSANIIVIGCANGVARCFNTTELRFLKNLPRPHSLGLDIATVNLQRKSTVLSQKTSTTSYPNIIGIGLDESLNAIACVHNDRSIYTWDLNDPSGRVVKRYSALYHSSCIWGIDTYPVTATNPLLPPGSFITCSSDDTFRVWHPNVFNSRLSSGYGKKRQNYIDETTTAKAADNNNDDEIAAQVNLNNVYLDNQFSDELSKIVFTDSACKFLCDLDGDGGAGCVGPIREDLNYDSTEGLRCLKISPSGTQLAVGNRSGAIRVFDFEFDAEIKNIAAHDAEVLCLEYSDPRKFSGYCYLASSSRDKLIHIFDASNNYHFLQTIDDHLSSITSLRFVNNRARDCLQLVSCGADQRIIFRNGIKLDSKQLNFVTDQHIEGKTTFYDMEVDSESSCLMTACQDRMIRLFNVAQVRHQSGFKGSVSDEGTLIKIALDPSCTFLAASCTDKSISVYDYQRGECLASVVRGLSDLITDMKFSHDGRYLVACSGNGCVFIWKSPAEIANAISGGGGGLNLAQLSLSSCSLGSLNKQSNLDLTIDPLDMMPDPHQQQKQRLKSLPDWARQQMMLNNEQDRNRYGSGESSGRSASNQQRGSSSAEPNKLSSDELDRLYEDLRPPSKQLEPSSTDKSTRFQVQKADSDDYVTITSSDHATVRPVDDNNCSTLKSVSQMIRHEVGGGNQSTRDESPRDGGMGQMSRMAKAKLFQSRENLERITSREKFLHEGLAHGGGGVDQASGERLHIIGNGSSLSGLFNTKLNHDADQIEGLPKRAQVGPNYVQLPARSTPNLCLQGQNLNNNTSTTTNNNVQADGNNCPANSSSSADEEEALSSEAEEDDDDDAEQISGPQRSNRPITPPKPSLHRQIRRNSGSQLGVLPNRSTAGSSSGQTSKTTTTTTRGNKAAPNRRLAHGTGMGSSAAAATVRSSRSECNLDLLSPTTTEQPKEELEAGGVRHARRQLQDKSIYCEKLDLSKLNPATTAELSQELCQYVVDELQALSKYATRLHQRLQANGQRSLSNMVARGVQNSMDILSIVPPRSSHHNHRFQSQVNVSPVSMLSRRGKQPLRRPASSNSILGTLPTTENEQVVSSTNKTAAAAYSIPKSVGSKRNEPKQTADNYKRSPQSANNYPGVSGPAQNDDRMLVGGLGSGSRLSNVAPAAINMMNQAQKPGTFGPQSASLDKANSTASNKNNNNQQLNLDQVLEAYSDRLFRMVQERMQAAEQQTGHGSPEVAASHHKPQLARDGSGNNNFVNNTSERPLER